MLRLFTLAGTVTHVVVGTSSLAWAAIHMDPATWLQAGVELLGPGLLGLAVTVFATLVVRRPEAPVPLSAIAESDPPGPA